VRGIEPRYSQSFMIGPSAHEVGVGYRYVNESTHEMRYYTATTSGELPSTASPYDRDTRSGTEAHAWYIDDRVDIGNWTITPGMRLNILSLTRTIICWAPANGSAITPRSRR
jgi:Fe(3+) dicitrate transport protein